MDKSSQSASRRKAGESRPAKPYAGFPLFPHATGRWAKKIRGRLVYFGRWRDAPDGGWQTALDLYQRRRDDLHCGRVPRLPSNGLTLRELANRFLTAKQRLVDSGDIVSRTFRDYYEVCARMVSHFGAQRAVGEIRAEDFEAFRADIAKTRGPVALANDITRVKMCFKWGFDSGLLDTPIRYGQSFQKPSRATLRKSRADRGPRMFTAADIRRMLDGASVPQRRLQKAALGSVAASERPKAAKVPEKASNSQKSAILRHGATRERLRCRRTTCPSIPLFRVADTGPILEMSPGNAHRPDNKAAPTGPMDVVQTAPAQC